MNLTRGTRGKILALFVALTFTTSGLLHALVPHDDTGALADLSSQCAAEYGYGHCPTGFQPHQDGHQSALWSFIHSALAHEEKKSFASDVSPYISGALLALSFLASSFVPRRRSRSVQYELQLARGVLAFRTFG